MSSSRESREINNTQLINSYSTEKADNTPCLTSSTKAIFITFLPKDTDMYTS